jgi:hypothetical protein
MMATLRFVSDWTHDQIGDIRPGEPLRIEYDPARLSRCRADRYGQRAWNIAAFLRFHPGGQEESGGLVPGPLEVSVPTDAAQVELWFKNTDHTGCVAWDSRYGQNYWLNVARS